MSVFQTAVERIHALREDNTRLEALLRAKDETIGELLDVIDMHPAELASVVSFVWEPR